CAGVDLRTGRSIWQTTTTQIDNLPCLPLDHDEACDVLIIGGGITGVLTTKALAADGMKVIVVDKRPIAAGSTVASTSLLMYELDASLTELQDRGGWEYAAAAYHASHRALLSLADRIDRLDIECGFAWRRSLYFASGPDDVEDLHQEAVYRRKAGFAVDFLAGGEVEAVVPFSAPAALLSELAAEADPLRLTCALLSRAIRDGADVYPLTEVIDLQPAGDRIAATTRRGPCVSARKVILAAGYETQSILGWPLGSLQSTYVIASPPMSRLPWRDGMLIWESARPYLYLRTTADGRVIVGGGDVPFQDPKARDALLPDKVRELKDRVQRLFGGITLPIDCAWAGTFGESDDGLPIIGQVPVHPGLFVAAGYGGNGITFGALAADILCDACRDRWHPHSEIFAVSRLLSAAR
ncbi:MAG TPA: FAD-dependent oxidoreductase, partial [Phycisphaerales bacterium]|nr:FAD-dependent oxidoreductase [Phycisphaerales bacterium]